MAALTVGDRIMRALEDLPPDVTFEEAIERLVFLAKIDAGIAELDDGRGQDVPPLFGLRNIDRRSVWRPCGG